MRKYLQNRGSRPTDEEMLRPASGVIVITVIDGQRNKVTTICTSDRKISRYGNNVGNYLQEHGFDIDDICFIVSDIEDYNPETVADF